MVPLYALHFAGIK